MTQKPFAFRKVHLVGIKGVAMTALAQILKAQGCVVTGSDTEERFFTDEVLKKEGIEYNENFSALNMADDVQAVIYSTAYTDKNPEIQEAKRRALPLFTYPEILGEMMTGKFSVAVSGSHGKTTTTAMLGWVLQEAGLDPTVVVGSQAPQFNGNARVGASEYFIFEADEYQNKFTHYSPKAAIITSVDYDHPDFFKNEGEYCAAFRKLAEKIPEDGFIVACGDSPGVKEVVADAKAEVVFYGGRQGCQLKVEGCKLKGAKQFFSVESLGEFSLQIPGRHNVLNALAVIGVAMKLGINMEVVKKALANFQGTTRRFEKLGEYRGAVIYDDYAHHPTEAQAVLKTARELYPDRRIWCIFHPHTFTRTKALFDDFAQSFGLADKVIVIDIYGSARETHGGVHSRDLAEAINKHQNNALYISTKQEVVEYLKKHVRSNDIVITMGAGDVWRVGKELVSIIS